ncbi:MAG: hypothetical protein R2690_19595 [Acidimicrobiales bacterium]
MDEPVIGQVDAVDLEQTLWLLQARFRHPFDTTAFVDWVYNHNPVGPVYEEHVDEGGMQVAYRRRAGPLPERGRRRDFRDMYNGRDGTDEAGHGSTM